MTNKRNLPYGSKVKKKSYPCSFEGCEQTFSDPGKLLAHEDEHETGKVATTETVQEPAVGKLVRKRGVPYANEKPGEELEDVELPPDND